ncbi:MAG: hypothetical protein GY839_20655 [candidate division Zixibacteria bacterium]|nr:hypothetical protein [candidate division Zixibacteria bacterium]
MKNYITLIMLWIFLCCPINIVLADQPSTNEQFVMQSITKAANELIDSLKIKSSHAKIEPVSGISELAADGFKRALLVSGYKIDNSDENNALVADISLSAFDFKYTKGKSRGFLKKRFIRREFSGQIIVKFTGDNYNYIGYKEFSGTDEVAPSEANYVASIRYNQLSPEAPGGGAMKYLEPLAVTATVGGLIYLFFINR